MPGRVQEMVLELDGTVLDSNLSMLTVLLVPNVPMYGHAHVSSPELLILGGTQTL